MESGTGYVTLLGQTVDAWRHEGKRFCDLLERVAEVAPRVWFTTSHPSNMEDRTLRLIGEKATIVKRLHLPVQSGSDRMLKVMHRGYKAERYRRKIEVFREAVPDGTLSTDIIVGHPGETEEDEQTLKLVELCIRFSAHFQVLSEKGHGGRRARRHGAAGGCAAALPGGAKSGRAERLLAQPAQGGKPGRCVHPAREHRGRQGHRRDLERPRGAREDGQRARRVRQGQDRVCGAARPVRRGAGVA